jgi:two-component system LytT family response regulator
MNPPLKKALIIDDDQDAIDNLQVLLKDNNSIQIVGTITNPMLAIDMVRQLKPDLIFLDIQMPDKDGFEVLRDMLKESLRTEVIFITAYDRFAIDAIRFSALDYLLKPVSPYDLNNALMRFLSKSKDSETSFAMNTLLEKTIHNTNKLKFNTHSGFFLLAPEDIVYIQADWNYSEVYLGEKRSELITINIGKLEEMLPKHLFYRISRSIIINVSLLVKVNRRKRLAFLEKDGKEFSFKIPLLNIRKIENFLDGIVNK